MNRYDEKMRDVLLALAFDLTPERPEVEIGDSGLKLQMRVEKTSKLNWLLQPSEPIYDQLWVGVVDSDGAYVCGYGRGNRPPGSLQDDGEVRRERRRLVDLIVDGRKDVGGQQGIGAALERRYRLRKIELKQLREAASLIPQAEKRLEEAEKGFDWAQSVYAQEAELKADAEIDL